jgi:hypothetical protein
MTEAERFTLAYMKFMLRMMPHLARQLAADHPGLCELAAELATLEAKAVRLIDMADRIEARAAKESPEDGSPG